MRFFTLLYPLLAGILGLESSVVASPGRDPRVTLKNGTYKGVYSSEYEQDFFLGIPFAQPPVGELRFRNPAPLNNTWTGVRDATAYSASCAAFTGDDLPFADEDCLYLNVIRPSGFEKSKLPVAIWIHGGGFTQGSGINQRYNMSFTVQHSVEINQPIIGVTINYRLAGWGFMQSQEIYATGETNWGFRDQRLALHWIQENIGAFGGDPSKVTIYGESAGAMSVGLHLIAYNGRNDGLFRSAGMESGTPMVTSTPLTTYQPIYNKIVEAAGCSSAVDSLACLRNTPFDKLNHSLGENQYAWGPSVDGDILPSHGSVALREGNFVHVPILIGCNSDEGTSFTPTGLNTTNQFRDYLMEDGTTPMPRHIADMILKAYPLHNPESVLANLGPEWMPPASAEYGRQYRRTSTYAGDQVFIANRRLTCKTYAEAGLAAYCYRFNAVPNGFTPLQGATHYTEVGFVFLDLLGVGWNPPTKEPPFQGKGPEYKDLARLMNGDWISFIYSGNPNSWPERRKQAKTLATPVPMWPKYDQRHPKNYLYNANVSSTVELDIWRAEGIDLITSFNEKYYLR